jgi:hypothetical protein
MGCFSSKEIRCSFRVAGLTFDNPELQIFDLNLHSRTVRAIQPFGDGIKMGSFSIDSLGDLAESVLDTQPEVVESILRSKEQFWKNKEILNLVQMYLDSILKTLDFLTSLKECLDHARNRHSILQSAINVFKKENPASLKKTLDILKVFQAAENPFSDEFYTQFECIYKQQTNTLNKLIEEKSRLDAKLKSAKAWKKVSYTILTATFAVVVILTLIAAVVAAPPMVAALAAAAALPLGPIEGWMTLVWSRIEKEVRGESGIIGTTRDHTRLAKIEMENVCTIVNTIVTDLESLSKMAEFGVENQEKGLKTAIEDMKKISKGLSRSIDKLEKRIVRSRRYISWTRTVILKKVEKHQNSDQS